MAPMVYWPSAPMFQTLARNASASPTPIRISGAALTASSGGPLSDVSGSMGNVYSAGPGARPRRAKIAAQTPTVSAPARVRDAPPPRGERPAAASTPGLAGQTVGAPARSAQ